MSREYGRGSIVSFIVVGVLLVALVLGGLYVTKNELGGWVDSLGSQTDEQPREVASDDTSDQANDDAPRDDAPKPDDKEEAPAPDDEPVAAPEEPVADDTEETPAPAPDNTDATDEDEGSEVAVKDEENDDATIPTAGVELPQTGLADSALAALPVVVLVGAVVAYRRSNIL